MTDTKGILQSRTVLSLAAMVIVYLVKQFVDGVEIDEQQLTNILVVISGAIAGGGFRVVATKPIEPGKLLKKE